MSSRHWRLLPTRGLSAPRRRQAGTSVLAALILVAVLSTVVYAVEALKPSGEPGSQTALVGPLIYVNNRTSPEPVKKEEEKKNADKDTQTDEEILKKCDAAIAAEKSGETTKTAKKAKPGLKLSDDCIGVVPDKTMKAKYRCVGKSATITIMDNGTLTIKSKPNPKMLPGTCATVACQSSDALADKVLPGTNAKCIAADMDGVDKNKLLNALSGKTSGVTPFYATGLALEDAMVPREPLDSSTLKVLNNAFGKSPLDETGTMPMSNIRDTLTGKDNYVLDEPAADQIAQIAKEDPNKEAEEASKKIDDAIVSKDLDKDKVELDPSKGDPSKKMFCPGDPDCPGEPPIPGQKVAQDTYCIKQAYPSTIVIPIPAGSTFPEGCYNGVGAKPIPPPQTREAQTCPSGTYGVYPNCQRPYQGPPGSTFGNPSSGAGSGSSGMNSFLSGLMKGLTGQQLPPSPQQPPPGNQNPFPNGTCMPSYVCSNNSLYFRNSQCVDQMTQTCQYGCQGTQCAPAPQTQCPPAPAQPAASACPSGTWQEQRQTISTGASCVTGWKCVTAPIGTTTPPVPEPTALLSCQPRVADIGMEIAITYTCGNASSSVAVGFSTGGRQTSGSTTTIASAPAGTNTITYGLTCINQDKTARAQCVVQVGRPSIVLVANPKTVKEGEASSVGWITSGMQSCVVSSPDLPEFTAENADKKNVNGTAPTPPLTKNANIVLKCATLGGGERTATTTITVIEATGPRVSVRSSFDGRTITRGTVASIEWQVTKATSTNSSVALWLIDVQSQESVALIAGGRPLSSGTYSWTVPSTGEPCPSETPYVCAGDIVPGQSYAIQASVYTPQNADLSRNPPAGAPRPVYIASGISAAFTLGQ